MPLTRTLVAAALATVLAAAAFAPAARAQEAVLPAGLVAQLVAATRRPLDLAPTGDPARFLAAGAAWEEMAPPLILDVDRDGVRDFVVLLLSDGQTGHRALVVHEWGSAPEAFGQAVLYVIVDGGGAVREWAGTHHLAPAGAPPAPGPPKP